jgi:putative PEP-CTERM system histidine kinase
MTIAVWSHALAAVVFAGLLAWRLIAGVRQPGHRLLLAAFALTACWAWLEAITPGASVARYAESARNLVWVGLLHSVYASSGGEGRDHGIRPVYAAVSAVLGLQLVLTTVRLTTVSPAVEETAIILHITAAAGSLVLVHNLYGQASPASRSAIRYAMLALVLSWIYDLNLYTITYLDPPMATGFADWRGAAVAITGPLFAMAARREDDWKIRLSRAATFQSLSLLAICAYFAVMAILATALRGTGFDWPQTLAVTVLAVMTVAAMVLLPSRRARAWAKVKIAKHLFEHRYDYRTEWLRFTATLGTTGPEARPLEERVIKAFADILDSPAGLLLECDGSGAFTVGATWEWSGGLPSAPGSGDAAGFCRAIAASARIIQFDSIRSGVAQAEDRALPFPEWMKADRSIWIGIPLIHEEALAGFLLLAAPEYRRPLDWEDFDLLRTAARQAASSLAEAQGQRALSNAQRFEEFNRRFAFILHDIKNLVSQLSLLARNAERHADNAEFRADMIATLKGSIAKMNDLLARLTPQALAKQKRIEPVFLRDVLSTAIANRRRSHEILLLGEASQWVMADPAGLEQAIGHLIQNAVDASEDDQPVTVRVDRSGEEVAIAVSDKGCGMDPDFIRDQLFQPFASTKPNGFGIGAFEARLLITSMHGRLSVESTRGRGTQFTIHLPAAEAPEARQRKVA